MRDNIKALIEACKQSIKNSKSIIDDTFDRDELYRELGKRDAYKEIKSKLEGMLK